MPLIVECCADFACLLELEVAGGASAACLCRVSPALSARLGVDFAEHFTPSVRMMTFALPGSEDHSWAVLGELRAHTKGRFQVNAGVGLGFGQAHFNAGPDGIFNFGSCTQSSAADDRRLTIDTNTIPNGYIYDSLANQIGGAVSSVTLVVKLASPVR